MLSDQGLAALLRVWSPESAAGASPASWLEMQDPSLWPRPASHSEPTSNLAEPS